MNTAKSSQSHETIVMDQCEKLHDVQCLLTAIYETDPGGHTSRLAAMAKTITGNIIDALDAVSDQLGTKARHD